jgi:hypothetical protein
MATYNLKETKSGSTFDPIPEGRYTVVIDKADLTTTKESGNPMIKMTLKLIDGDHRNRYVWDNLVLTKSSLWKVKGVLEAVGSKVAEQESVTEQDIAAAVLGKHVSVYVEIRTDGTNTSNTVKNYTQAEQTAPAATPRVGGSLIS